MPGSSFHSANPSFLHSKRPTGPVREHFYASLWWRDLRRGYGGGSLRNRPSSFVLGRSIKKFEHEDEGRLEWLRIREQLETELQMIHDVGYEDYFLIVWDLLRGCRAQGIDWITRGSAADSLVCYCLGISSVCPVRFDLYFRRFLNRERMALNKLPDIDIDFSA